MEFKITSYTTSDQDDDCLVIVRYVMAIFYLRWSPGDLASAQQDYLADLRKLRDEDDNHNGLLTKLVLPFEDLVNHLMNQLAPTSVQAPFSLHDYLYPQCSCERSGVPVLSSWCGLTLQPNTRVGSQKLGTEVVRIAPDRTLDSPSKVITKMSRTECFFKGLGAGCEGTIHELVTFRAINNAINRRALPSDIRICRLYGLVVDAFGPPNSETRLVGMLLNYIDPNRRGTLSTLQCVAYNEHSHKHFRRWADNLDDIVDALQGAGCIWGDAKPENVLIDNDDDVWLVDFGGGYTPGWVDKEQQCTSEGDLRALEKIRQWLERLRTNCQAVEPIENVSELHEPAGCGGQDISYKHLPYSNISSTYAKNRALHCRFEKCMSTQASATKASANLPTTPTPDEQPNFADLNTLFDSISTQMQIACAAQRLVASLFPFTKTETCKLHVGTQPYKRVACQVFLPPNSATAAIPLAFVNLKHIDYPRANSLQVHEAPANEPARELNKRRHQLLVPTPHASRMPTKIPTFWA
ncbi:hypothetical protein PG993_010781 [Apiospora rasikravindrae]|uniref:Protein kinase domain-containing protein n=1 Tax=Apiospora rasikravindrae TaxID=990691 RepID=A0ABR1SDL6_9PEZI